ncbi:MAG: leucine-rich repeat protein, partial [Clostridia bacterium]|nr:leucine-rich repeat protein [Clostridia bacterium]
MKKLLYIILFFTLLITCSCSFNEEKETDNESELPTLFEQTEQDAADDTQNGDDTNGNTDDETISEATVQTGEQTDKEDDPAQEHKHVFSNNVCTECKENEYELVLDLSGEFYILKKANSDITGSVTIPSEYNGKPVKYIGSYAFRSLSVTNVTVPNGMTKIQKGAFSECSTLKSVSLPNTLTSIGDDAFGGCERLNEINFPKGLRYIGKNAFSSTALTDVSLPEGILVIDDGAFSGSSVRKAVIPFGTERIGNYVFSGASSLESIVLPQDMYELPEGSFSYCTSLKSVTLPSSLRQIHYLA